MSSLYKWTALVHEQQIRLLTLLPGNLDEPLQGELNVVSLSDNTKYEAISYSWESRELPATILCNGQRIPITSNLHAALDLFRLPNQPCQLWVDAICIDQSNDGEKASQVRLMGRIFGGAECVLVWLGAADDADDFAMRFIQEMRMDSRFGPSVDAMSDDEMLSVSDALKSLCSRGYWQRLFIVQEVALAKQVVLFCGRYEIHWKIITEAMLMSGSAIWTERLKVALAAKGRDAENGFLTEIFHTQGPRSLISPSSEASTGMYQDRKRETFRLAVMMADKACFDPRDKIFGIYSLLPPSMQRRINVDYSLETADIFLTAAKAFIQGAECLDIINWPNRQESNTVQLPFWVPDWSLSFDVTPYAVYHEYWNSTPDPRTNFVDYQIQDDGVLQIKGCTIGTITSTSECPILASKAQGPVSELELNELWLFFLECYLSTGGPACDSSIQSFLDCIGVQYKLEPRHFRDWLDTYSYKDSVSSPADFILPLAELDHMCRVRNVQTHRKFFLCDVRHDPLISRTWGWGMTSTAVREGDLLCVLPGCLLPVVLRARDHGKHVIVSDAYTDEALMERLLRCFHDGSIVRQDFFIC